MTAKGLKTLFMSFGVMCAGGGFFRARADPPTPERILLGYTREFRIEMLIGQYDPARGRWLANTDPFVPPFVQTPVTLFGPEGKRGEVWIADETRTSTDKQPWDWGAEISSWSRQPSSIALAVTGTWTKATRPVQAVPLDDAPALGVVKAFLTQHKLNVDRPRLTQVWKVDLDGDGRLETLICANSDNTVLTDTAPAAVYALALLQTQIGGRERVLPVRTAFSYKPASQSLDEHERFHGRFADYEVLAILDIVGNGQAQIAIYNDNRYEGPEVDLFTYAAGQVSRVLATRQLYH